MSTSSLRADEETRVEVLLRSGIAVKLRMLDAQGQPFEEQLRCKIFDARGKLGVATVLPRFGPIEWSGRLLPGSYRFVARHADGRAGELAFEVSAEAAPRPLELRLR